MAAYGVCSIIAGIAKSIAVARRPKEKEVGSGAPHRLLGVSAYCTAVQFGERSNQRVQMTYARSVITQTWGPTKRERNCGSATFHDTMVRTGDLGPVTLVPPGLNVDRRRATACLPR